MYAGIKNKEHWSEESKAICQRKIVELLVQNCSGTFVDLQLWSVAIIYKMMPMLEPLLEHLQTMRLRQIQTGDVIVLYYNLTPSFNHSCQTLFACKKIQGISIDTRMVENDSTDLQK